MVRLAEPTRKACGTPERSQAAHTFRWASERPLVGAVGAVPVEHSHVAALNEAESGVAVGVGG